MRLLLRPASAEAPRDGGDGGEGAGVRNRQGRGGGREEEAFYARVRGLSYAQALKNAVRRLAQGQYATRISSRTRVCTRCEEPARWLWCEGCRARQRAAANPTLLRIVVRLPEFAESATLLHRYERASTAS